MEMINGRRHPVVNEIKELKKRAARDQSGLAFIEGRRLVTEALTQKGARAAVKYICMSESFAGGAGYAEILSRAAEFDIKLYLTRDYVFEAIAVTRHPQGLLAVIGTACYSLSDMTGRVCGRNRLLLLDRVSDPGNAGGMVRTAWAAGISGVIFSEGCVDAYEPKVTRATMGGVFHVPFLRGADLAKIINELRAGGYEIYAASAPKRDADRVLDCFNGAYGAGDVALIIGGEAFGVSCELMEMCDASLSIPMPGGAESLNAGVAAGILMYELVRRERRDALC